MAKKSSHMACQPSSLGKLLLLDTWRVMALWWEITERWYCRLTVCSTQRDMEVHDRLSSIAIQHALCCSQYTRAHPAVTTTTVDGSVCGIMTFAALDAEYCISCTSNNMQSYFWVACMQHMDWMQYSVWHESCRWKHDLCSLGCRMMYFMPFEQCAQLFLCSLYAAYGLDVIQSVARFVSLEANNSTIQCVLLDWLVPQLVQGVGPVHDRVIPELPK